MSLTDCIFGIIGGRRPASFSLHLQLPVLHPPTGHAKLASQAMKSHQAFDQNNPPLHTWPRRSLCGHLFDEVLQQADYVTHLPPQVVQRLVGRLAPLPLVVDDIEHLLQPHVRGCSSRAGECGR